MPLYQLTEDADADLEEIIRYTLSQWGVEQAQLYTDKLHRCFEKIPASPSDPLRASLHLLSAVGRKTAAHICRSARAYGPAGSIEGSIGMNLESVLLPTVLGFKGN